MTTVLPFFNYFQLKLIPIAIGIGIIAPMIGNPVNKDKSQSRNQWFFLIFSIENLHLVTLLDYFHVIQI